MHPVANQPNATDAPPTSLRQLRRGQVGMVLAVTHPEPTVRQKYIARGIVPGARLQVLQGGDPIVIAIDDGRWAVDGDEASHIEVAVIEESAVGWWQRAVASMRRAGGSS